MPRCVTHDAPSPLGYRANQTWTMCFRHQQRRVNEIVNRTRKDKDKAWEYMTPDVRNLMNASQALQARNKELEPLAKCALELRKWFLDNEFWNDENSEDIFPILEKHGLVECVEYDPAIHNCDNNEPGDTIWYFPPLAGESV